jgi:hypothetical protein
MIFRQTLEFGLTHNVFGSAHAKSASAILNPLLCTGSNLLNCAFLADP